MHEPPGFVRELDRRMAILSVAGRFAAAIGVSAIVALFFVIMVPAVARLCTTTGRRRFIGLWDIAIGKNRAVAAPSNETMS